MIPPVAVKPSWNTRGAVFTASLPVPEKTSRYEAIGLSLRTESHFITFLDIYEIVMAVGPVDVNLNTVLELESPAEMMVQE